MSSPLVLFDIDGTLIDTGGAGMRALDRVFEELYGKPDVFANYSFSGKVDRRILLDAFQQLWKREPTASETEAVRSGYLERLDEELANTPHLYKVLPGVRELLERLRTAGIPTGLATGNLAEGAERKLSLGNLWQYFPFGGYGSDHEHRGKLTRIGIERAQSHTGLDFAPEAVVIVGDSPLDIKAARYNNTRVIGVLTGWDPPETMVAAKPDLLLDDLSDTDAVMDFVLGGASPSG
jgi:phosphoglycolate phosphatase